jgi:Period protein 2/3C-terminal region
MTGTSEDESSHSSFYSSFLKTDEGPTSSNEDRNEKFKYDSGKDTEEMHWEKTPKIPVKRPNPHWLDNINVTPELVYRYQINARSLSDVLSDDLYKLKNIHQVRKEKLE